MSQELALAGWAGHAGFELLGTLGEGGFGVVYEALDRERGERVALKVLKRRSKTDLERFKREFRDLAHLTHPNLPLLYELFCLDEPWFFTMELLRGSSLRAYIHGDDRDDRGGAMASAIASATRGTWTSTAEPPPAPPSAAARGAAQLDEERLDRCLEQLADVLTFLHRRGFVHGDVKPSNVLVRPDGHLFLLDFGLVRRDDETRDGFAGTSLYAAPELLRRGRPAPEQDVYSVGAMVFDLIAGAPPFPGPGLQPMLDKVRRAAPPIASVAPSVSPRLARRVDRWLDRDPARRGGLAGRSETVARGFVGRTAERGALLDAYRRAEEGRSEVVVVVGRAGFGKSALVEDALASIGGLPSRPLILSSRASPKEHVPFNALDGLLSALPPLDVERAASRRDVALALKSAIRREAGERVVVIWLDDLHWADADSLSVLEEMLHPPRLRAALFVLSRRPAEPGYATLVLPCPSRTLEVGPLLHADALTLVAAHGVSERPAAETLVSRARGHALFLEELCSGGDLRSADVPELVALRAARLSPHERALLELVCVSQAALPSARLRVLVADEDADVARSLEALCRARLLRPAIGGGGGGGEGGFAPFHDLIRETVVDAMPDERRRARHEAIARSLDPYDPRQVPARIEHLRGAGRAEEAATLAIQEARAAARAKAFAQAAELLRVALELGADESLREERLEALERAQLPCDAGDAALELARTEPDAASKTRLGIRAAKHYLASGELARGHAVLRELLAQSGVPWPETEVETFARLVLARLVPRWRSNRALDRELVLELLCALAEGLGMIDNARGSFFMTCALAAAEELGDPRRLAWVLLNAAMYLGSMDERRRAKGRAFVRRARALYPGPLPPDLAAYELAVLGTMSFQEAPSREASELLARAERAFSDLDDGGGPSLGNVGIIRGHCLRMLGDLTELRAQAERLARVAEHRADSYLRTTAKFGGHVIWLADDAPEASRHLLESVPWPEVPGAFHFQHWLRTEAEVETSLYEGDGRGGWERIRAVRASLLLSLIRQIQSVRISCDFTFGRALVGFWEAGGARRVDLLASFELVRRRLLSERNPAAAVRSHLLGGGAAALAGRRARAARHLRTAREIAEANGHAYFGALAELGLGALGVSSGDAQARAEAVLRSMGVVDPRRFMAVEVPGFYSASTTSSSRR
ncbi:MAG: protein kinase [Labilithrix sp.]|nr:protein kinase [Labilithrix sp.]MCW5811801.1 protein kinase [Labilithrix sp.]